MAAAVLVNEGRQWLVERKRCGRFVLGPASLVLVWVGMPSVRRVLTGTGKRKKAKNMHQRHLVDVSGACKRTVAAAVIVKGGRVWWSAVGRNGRLVLQRGREGLPTRTMTSTADFVWGVRCALFFFHACASILMAWCRATIQLLLLIIIIHILRRCKAYNQK